MKTKAVKAINQAPKAVKAKAVPAQAITPIVPAEPVQAIAPIATKAKAAVAAKADKPKRVSLNPQPILDAKTEALAAKGVKLTWAGRAWHAGGKTWTSLEMSKYSVDDFAALFPGK